MKITVTFNYTEVLGALINYADSELGTKFESAEGVHWIFTDGGEILLEKK